MHNWFGFPLDASAHGPALDAMTVYIHWGMFALAAGWGTYFLYALFRFRAGRQPQASYSGAKGAVSKASEVAVIVAEVALLAVFAIPTWAAWVRLPGPDAGALEVRVVGEQFAWNVHYPGADGRFGRTDVELVSSGNPLGLDRSDPPGADDITTINQLHLEVDRPVVVRLTSKDVIHSFGLPVMRVKQDAIPGMEIPIHFTPVRSTPPEAAFPACAASKSCWEIACAQLCGLGHFRMRGFLVVHEPADFAAWLAQQAAQLPAAATASPAAPPAEAPAEAHAQAQG
jgi:cytochrome c oxidase subunit 2